MFGSSRRRIRELEQKIVMLSAYIRELEAALGQRPTRRAVYDPFVDVVRDDVQRDDYVQDAPPAYSYHSGSANGFDWAATAQAGAGVDVAYNAAPASGLSSGAQPNTWSVSA
jgi:hypothetical protein